MKKTTTFSNFFQKRNTLTQKSICGSYAVPPPTKALQTVRMPVPAFLDYTVGGYVLTNQYHQNNLSISALNH